MDAARDESKRKQMAIVLRFVNKDGFIKECFFDIVHVSDTTLATLKEEICIVLSRHNLSVQNIHDQGSSYKRHDQLKVAQAEEIVTKLTSDEVETGKGKNQVGTLKWAGDTRWGSYLGSISSLINMFSATCPVLSNVINDGATSTQRTDADGVYDKITSFEFVFIVHLMRDIIGTTDDLCQALQRKSQDILNAMHLVSTTKALVQKYREDGWISLLENVQLFCGKYDIDIHDMSAHYTSELNNRFKVDVMELLILSSALDPRDDYSLFKIEDICKLANQFYPNDFIEQEKIHLKFQLQNYEIDILKHLEFQQLLTISNLCPLLVKTSQSTIYPLVDRLIHLVLTLPISTATTKRAFSAMKIVKTRLRNRMKDDFLSSYLLTFVEKDIA
ncbi:uncharacterized protein LOC114315969 [Camellia sinensis]|uniref:uncharacterized protein LOC114315969 n=1 Tax=Camellia sinensis TaxID=4442 RepID=UPI0010362089|nr:uncharacterized protein LOC114315969 [Camellia sinensis]